MPTERKSAPIPSDAWGVCELNGVSGITLSAVENYVAVNNPFRYRGYYYDTQTGFYYLQSRYYNPEWGRFLNADDDGGMFWDTIFDVKIFSFFLR